MRKEEDDRKHLTPRQIINRYRKGEYVDEGIEAISSAISSCSQPFDSNAVPFPSTIIEMVYDNIETAKVLYELKTDGKSTDATAVPDYPQLKEILDDLSYPALWESMKDAKGIGFFDIIKERGLQSKYIFDYEGGELHKVSSFHSITYKNRIEETGLSYFTFDLVLHLMLRERTKETDRQQTKHQNT